MKIDKSKLQVLFDSNDSIKSMSKVEGIAYETLRNYFIIEYGLAAFNLRKTRLKKAAMSGLNNYQSKDKLKGKPHRNTKNPEDKAIHISNTGYRMIGTPDWFKGLSNGGFSLEHQVIYCKFNNLTKVPKGYVIHHKDENKLNNDPSNLELISRSDHTKLHNPQKHRIY